MDAVSAVLMRISWLGEFVEDIATASLTDMVVKATKSKSWAAAVEKNNWTPAWLTGKAFDEFVDKDFSLLRATMVRAGMV